MAQDTGDTYIINKTDPNSGYFTVASNARVGAKGGNPIRGNEPDIRFYGRSTQDWGEGVNENFMRILENFACPEVPGTATAPIPQGENYLGNGYGVNNPVKGQLWYNTTQDQLFVFDGSEWRNLCCGDSSSGDGTTIEPEEIQCCIGFGGSTSEEGPGGGYGGDPTVTPSECCGYGSMGGTIEGDVIVDLSNYVRKSGDIMIGTLVLSGDPVTSLEAATKRYVDDAISSVQITGSNLTDLNDVNAPYPQAGHVLTFNGSYWTSISPTGGLSSSFITTVKDYGATGDGVTDDTASFINAMASSKILYVPPGTYKISSPITNTVSESHPFFMFGAGPELSNILFTNTDQGFIFELTSSASNIRNENEPYLIGMRGLGIETTKQASGSAIHLYTNFDGQINQGVIKVFEQLSISGNQSIDGWAYGITYTNVTRTISRDITFRGISNPSYQGVGIYIDTPDITSREHFVQNCNVNVAEKAIQTTGTVTTLNVSNLDAIGVDYGVHVVGNAATKTQVNISDSNITSVISCIKLQDTEHNIINGNKFFSVSNDNLGIILTAPNNSGWSNNSTNIISSNLFNGTGLTGIEGVVADLYVQNILINNNVFKSLDTGISLSADTRGVQVGLSNQFISVATPYEDNNPTYNEIQVIPTVPTELSDLTDIDTSGVNPGDMLEFDGAVWVPVTPSDPPGILQVKMANNASVKTMTAAGGVWTTVVSVSVTKVDGTDIAIQAFGSLTGFNDTVDMIECEGTIDRDGTQIGDIATTDVTAGVTDEMTHGVGITYIDSGLSAGTYTYSVMIRGVPQAPTTITDQAYGSNFSITVMEIR